MKDGIDAMDGNRLIAEMSPDDRRALLAASHRTRLERGQLVLAAGHPVSGICFPEGAILSLVEVMRDRSWQDIALVGPEGAVGWSALLGHESEPYVAVVQVAGAALAVPIEAFERLADARPALRGALLRYVGGVMAQMGQSVIAAREGRVDRQIARWLLMFHDRIDGDVLPLTHERLAHLLGVRRASVTDCLHVLEGEIIIRCARGQVIVRDRAALERIADERYGTAEDRYRRLVADAVPTATAPIKRRA